MEKRESLETSVTHTLEEARMLLPGIQSLFGFQLIAVFSDTFHSALTPGERKIHLAAISLVTISMALCITPAAYHRQSEPRTISDRFVQVSTWLLTWTMPPLMTALSLDFYLIARLVLGGFAWPVASAIGIFAIFAALWFGVARWRALWRTPSARDS